MGLLVNGEWTDHWYDTKSTGGRFVRQDSQFRAQIGDTEYPAEAGRYHLYVSYACPWAHRTLIFRELKGLQDIISYSVVDPLMLDQGWTFGENGDPVNGKRFLHEVYTAHQSDYTGRVTVPVLWDKRTQTIVNNESSEIIRMLNSEFNALTGNRDDYYPQELRADIDALNAFVYSHINNGVYKAGFATTQEAYEEAVAALFDTLETIEARLAKSRYLVGDTLTEADWRLFTTLVRFDPVYVGHFKCNLKTLTDYPNISNYVRELYQMDGIAGTVHMDHIKDHYYKSHRTINPTGVVPLGPALTFDTPHNRNSFADRA